MYRLVGASEVIREAVPAELVPVVWAVTLLGSAKFLMVGLALLYWNVDDHRDRLLALVSVAFVALAVTLVLKYWFDLPRPPAAVQRYPVEPSPVGFPSGHAIAATVVYGGLLVAFDRYRDGPAVLAVGGLVVAIGLSRVVLGVHYLGDVLAGFAVGLVVLGGLTLVLEDRADRGFGLATALAVPALVVTGGNADAALALGGGLGGLVGSVWRTGAVTLTTTRERVVANLAGLGFLGAVLVLVEAVETVLLLAAAVNVLLVFGIVAVPLVVARSAIVRSAPTG